MLSFSPGVQGFNLSGDKLNPILKNLIALNRNIPVFVHTGHHSNSTPAQLFLLARRFPEINFVMGHSGSTDYATDVTPVVRQCENIAIESSFARPAGFVARLKDIGYDCGIMGSGFPYNDLVFEWSEMLRLLPKEHHEQVCGGNLMKLLR